MNGGARRSPRQQREGEPETKRRRVFELCTVLRFAYLPLRRTCLSAARPANGKNLRPGFGPEGACGRRRLTLGIAAGRPDRVFTFCLSLAGSPRIFTCLSYSFQDRGLEFSAAAASALCLPGRFRGSPSIPLPARPETFLFLCLFAPEEFQKSPKNQTKSPYFVHTARSCHMVAEV